jgi:hypothetical protein
MVSRQVISGVVLLSVLATAPAFAAEGQRRRSDSERRGGESQAQRGEGGSAERAVPRSRAAGRPADAGAQRDDARREQAQQAQAQRQSQQAQAQRQDRAQQQQAQINRQYRAEQQRAQVQRQYRSERQYDARRNDAFRRPYQRPHYYSNRGYGYGSRTIIVPRFITPRFVTVVPYRPYHYRPSFGIGVYYGSGGSYPYGYTPRGYYDPIPGRAYGGLRITGASRIAEVFADGYYVGIVNDFDGVFQNLNLEAGPHQIEIREPGRESIVFDVMVQPGRTTTFRVDEFRY